ncbi:MAG: type 1 periplasmic binding fold superfamily protein [Chitinophagales bacterium]|nr:type 1 periplasmic binding fold superfamily protein [Chitinophagales bacterium]
MKTTKILASVLILATLFFAGCKKDPVTPPNEEELITTMILSLQKQGSPSVQNFVFNDPDGTGGISATIDSIIIEKAAVYSAKITLLNSQSTPVDSISNEVLEEGTDHQFFYLSTPSNVLSSFTYDGENDTNGNPIGLDFSFATWNAGGSGNLKITLRHQPDKNAVGVSSGDIANANGETDIEVEFPVRLY